MIRVGFVLGNVNDAWLGGFNYFRNLLSAIALLEEKKLQPVIFISPAAKSIVEAAFRNVEVVESNMFSSSGPRSLFWRAVNKLPNKYKIILNSFFLDLLLSRKGINVLSHFGSLPRRSKIKTIGWIPDFQHLHLPGFFSQQDIVQRNGDFLRIVRGCDRVLLSSASAVSDLANFSPKTIGKCRVLNFVPEIGDDYKKVSLKDLQVKYKFDSPYFYLPNQFWVHKNHKIVIDALIVLKANGLSPLIVATGKEYDYRHPQHFSETMARVTSAGLEESFRSLGIVPYEDLLALMHFSLAVINPSLFEGWSSTVEEAKALGKRILLSDLPVHREQNPKNASFFLPTDANTLARSMLACIEESANSETSTVDFAAYSESRTRFACEYEKIVLELANATDA